MNKYYKAVEDGKIIGLIVGEPKGLETYKIVGQVAIHPINLIIYDTVEITKDEFIDLMSSMNLGERKSI